VLPQVDLLGTTLSRVAHCFFITSAISAPRARIPVSSLPHVNATIPDCAACRLHRSAAAQQTFLAAAAIILVAIPRFFLCSQTHFIHPSRSAATKPRHLSHPLGGQPNSAPPAPPSAPSTNLPAASPLRQRKALSGTPSPIGNLPKAPAQRSNNRQPEAATNPPANTAKIPPLHHPRQPPPSEPAPSRLILQIRRRTRSHQQSLPVSENPPTIPHRPYNVRVQLNS
jgi:hypothetical protein